MRIVVARRCSNGLKDLRQPANRHLLAFPMHTGENTLRTSGFRNFAIPWLVRRRIAVSVFLFALVILFDLLFVRSAPRSVVDATDPIVALADLAIVFGLFLRSWAAGTLWKRMKLATTGPYSHIRNPLYVGSFLMMVGFCALLSPLLIPLAVGPIAFIYRLAILDEERQLAAIFPNRWPQYAECVPRILPHRLRLPEFRSWSLTQWLRNGEYNAILGSLAGLAAAKYLPALFHLVN